MWQATRTVQVMHYASRQLHHIDSRESQRLCGATLYWLESTAYALPEHYASWDREPGMHVFGMSDGGRAAEVYVFYQREGGDTRFRQHVVTVCDELEMPPEILLDRMERGFDLVDAFELRTE